MYETLSSRIVNFRRNWFVNKLWYFTSTAKRSKARISCEKKSFQSGGDLLRNSHSRFLRILHLVLLPRLPIFASTNMMMHDGRVNQHMTTSFITIDFTQHMIQNRKHNIIALCILTIFEDNIWWRTHFQPLFSYPLEWYMPRLQAQTPIPLYQYYLLLSQNCNVVTWKKS